MLQRLLVLQRQQPTQAVLDLLGTVECSVLVARTRIGSRNHHRAPIPEMRTGPFEVVGDLNISSAIRGRHVRGGWHQSSAASRRVSSNDAALRRRCRDATPSVEAAAGVGLIGGAWD